MITYPYPTGADASQLYAWAQRLVQDMNRVEGSRTDALRSLTASAEVSASDYFLAVNATSGPVTITLPAVTLGRQIVVKKTDASSNAVTLTGGTIDGATSFTFSAQNESISVIGSATGWLVI